MKYFSIILVAALLFSTSLTIAQLPFNSPSESKAQSISHDKLIDFYPNPSKGSFKININDKDIKELNLKVYDLNGSIVFEKVFTGLFAGISFDMKLKKPGLYLVKIDTGKEQFVEKLLVKP